MRLRGSTALVLVLAAVGCPPRRAPAPPRTRAPGPTPATRPATGPLPHAWPPQKGQPFPDLQLQDDTGATVALSSLRGRVVLVEPVGMSCPACQAFTGAGGPRGGLGGVVPQPDLPAIEDTLRESGIDPSRPDLALVQVLFFDLRLATPSVADAKAWVEHFGLRERGNVLALVGDDRYRTHPATYAMVPGFFLVDREGTLRIDDTGTATPEDRAAFLPTLKRLLAEGARGAAGGGSPAPATFEDWYPDDITPPAGTQYPCGLTALPRALPGIPQGERRFVNHVASLLLRAIHARLRIWSRLAGDGEFEAYTKTTTEARAALAAEPAPAGLQPLRDDLLAALDGQLAFHTKVVAGVRAERSRLAALRGDEQARRFQAVVNDLVAATPEGRQASGRLIAAWGKLEAHYGATWDPAVKDSLYHHLCALDVF